MSKKTKQPVLLTLRIWDDTDLNRLGEVLEEDLRKAGWDVEWAIPVQRTDGVPAGMVTRG